MQITLQKGKIMKRETIFNDKSQIWTATGFLQKGLIKHSLKSNDCEILRWIINFRDSNRMEKIIHNNEQYIWINHGYVVASLPFLEWSTRTIQRRFTHYEERGLIKKYIVHLPEGGSRMYFVFTDLFYEDLISDPIIKTNSGPPTEENQQEDTEENQQDSPEMPPEACPEFSGKTSMASRYIEMPNVAGRNKDDTRDIDTRDNKKINKKENPEVVSKDLQKKEYSFKRFWEIYDYDKAEKSSRNAYKKLTLSEKKEIFEKLPKYIKSTPDKRFRLHASKYLTQKRWKDKITSEEFNNVQKSFNNSYSGYYSETLIQRPYNPNTLSPKQMLSQGIPC